MLIYGTGCDDWANSIYTRRVRHVHPHTDHPNATVHIAVEPVHPREVIQQFNVRVWVPPELKDLTNSTTREEEQRKASEAASDAW
eukprot:gene8503-35955_t